MREYCEIMARDEKDYLRQMLESASNIGNCFTPLSYLKSVSKKLTKSMSDLSLSMRTDKKVEPRDLINQKIPYLEYKW